jgi:hypothetical protein
MAKNEVKSLRAKLVEIRRSLGKVEKTKRNPHFGYSYVSLEQLNALLEPKLSEHNIFLATSVVKEETHYGQPKEGVFASVETEHTFYDADSETTIVGKSSGLGWDAGDKATAKAITAALKSYLKANFMISDEADDPEAHGEPPTATATGHRPTREYEREGEQEDAKKGKEITDLMQLSTWMADHKVPESFVLAMLVEKKLINANVKKLGNVQPGILRRLLNPGSLERLKKAWEDSKVPSGNGKEVRTKEGDQTRDESVARTFCKADDIDPQDYLEQEGVRDWRLVKVPSGKNKGIPLGKLAVSSLRWYLENWQPEYKGKITEVATLFDAALCLASAELMQEAEGGGYGDI